MIRREPARVVEFVFVRFDISICVARPEPDHHLMGKGPWLAAHVLHVRDS